MSSPAGSAQPFLDLDHLQLALGVGHVLVVVDPPLLLVIVEAAPCFRKAAIGEMDRGDRAILGRRWLNYYKST